MKPAIQRSLVLISSLLFAGCGGAQGSAGSPAATSSASIASVSGNPSASAAPAASSGAQGAGSAAASGAPGSIKIGYITDLTGTTADVGKNSIDGFNLYLESVGNTVAGRKIEVVPADDQIKPDVGVTKAKQLTESDHVQLIAGILNAAVCYAMADWDKTAQVPLVISDGCNGQYLTTDPRFQSPYLARITGIPMSTASPISDWAIKQNLKKAILITPDNAGGIEAADTFAAGFIKNGGTVVQEMHPTFGTADFGPFIAQLDSSADTLYTFLPGADGLRFLPQFQNYESGKSKLAVIDFIGGMTDAPSLLQEKDTALGVIAGQYYNPVATTEPFQKLASAFKAKYPGRPLSNNNIQGYASAQVITAAIQKVNGAVENKQAFMDALYATDVDTAKGPIKLDKFHDVVQNMYMLQVIKNADGSIGKKLLDTYPAQTQFGSFTADQVQKLKSGTNKGKWPGMTKAQLQELIGS